MEVYEKFLRVAGVDQRCDRSDGAATLRHQLSEGSGRSESAAGHVCITCNVCMDRCKGTSEPEKRSSFNFVLSLWKFGILPKINES